MSCGVNLVMLADTVESIFRVHAPQLITQGMYLGTYFCDNGCRTFPCEPYRIGERILAATLTEEES